MSQKDLYRERVGAEVSAWIDPAREGNLREKFWYIESARVDNGLWHIILGEEQLFYSATRLCEPQEASQSEDSEESLTAAETSFGDLGLRCEVVLDEVKRVITDYLTSSGGGKVKAWRVSVGEQTYRILNGERLEAWQDDPRRFLAEYTLIESEMRETTTEQNVPRQG